jgi:hypothetical protein
VMCMSGFGSSSIHRASSRLIHSHVFPQVLVAVFLLATSNLAVKIVSCFSNGMGIAVSPLSL